MDDGRFLLMRHTMGKRMKAKLVEIKETLNRMLHVPVPEQGRWLGQVVRGYLAYHAVPILEMNADSYRLGQSRARKAKVEAYANRPQQASTTTAPAQQKSCANRRAGPSRAQRHASPTRKDQPASREVAAVLATVKDAARRSAVACGHP
jgi:hypothetical protein